jgi:hypothetical protein
MMTMNKVVFLLFLFVCSLVFGQKIVSKTKLSLELSEISGIELWRDSILVAINDGGNLPEVYFLDFSGNIIHKAHLKGARNMDWEDLAISDQDTLYIGDFGNNLGNRIDRAIYKINLADAWKSDTITSLRMSISFEGQPYQKEKIKNHPYDCEALCFFKDTLWMISKNRIAKKGTADIKKRQPILYAADAKIGGKAIMIDTIPFTKIRSGYKDQVTGADIINGKLYFLTYDGLYQFVCEKSLLKQEINFKSLTQKEAIVFLNQKSCFIAAERFRWLGGPYLYKVEWK